MKKSYTKPEISIKRFEVEDVITASSVDSLAQGDFTGKSASWNDSWFNN